MQRYLFLIVVFIISHPSLFAQISSIPFHPALPAGVSSIQKINRESGQDSLFSSRSFFIRNVIDQSKWNSRSFTLFRQSEEVNLWVDTSFVFKTLPKDSLGSVLDSLFIFLTQKTPPGSLNPNLGIVPLENQIYSPPSDIDGNSRVDFLLTDIQDEFEGGGGFIAGFFDPVNQLEYEKSNQREILYIDSYPTLYYNGKINIGMGAQTMAHEYQHLIHFQFMTLENLEWTAINEGCSELTEYLTGFSPRPIPAFKVNTEKGWSFWDEENVILSYERSSVFMSWFYFRFGLKALRSIIKSEKAGFAGLQEGLLKAGISVYPKDLQVWFAEDWVQRGFSSSGLKSIFPVFWQEEFGFSPFETISQFPGLLNYNLESGGFASLKIQFGRQYSADWHSDKPVKVSLLHQSTTGAANWVKSIEPPFEFTSSNPDDDYYIVFSNPDFGTTEFEKKAVKVTVSLSAQQQSGLFVLKTDDGQPDPFYGSAIFLKCPDSTLAYAFWLEDSTGDGFSGIREVSLLTGFLSEFEGTGVGSSESRQFEIEFRTELEVPEYQVIKVTSSRTYGRLKFESHPVPLNHPVYFLKTKGIWVIVRQTLGTSNPVVLGMDRSGGSNFKILRQDNSITVPVDIFNPEYRLEGMNPMIRLSVVKPVEEKTFQSSPVFTFRNDTTFISFSDLRTDSVDYIRLVITNEKGTYVLKTNWNSSANLEATPDFMVPFYLTGYSLFQLERTVNHLVDVSRFSACFFQAKDLKYRDGFRI